MKETWWIFSVLLLMLCLHLCTGQAVPHVRGRGKVTSWPQVDEVKNATQQQRTSRCKSVFDDSIKIQFKKNVDIAFSFIDFHDREVPKFQVHGNYRLQWHLLHGS